MKSSRKLFAVAFLLFMASSTYGQTVRVAAAADLRVAMSNLATQYEKRTGTKLDISYGSSGNFRTQIENGAPFDVFFSADATYPQELVETGLADAETLVVYAQGHLVLWASADQDLHIADRGFEALKDPRVAKIAIANPEHAPYGSAAVAALQKAGLYDQLKSKLVLGENISQTAQFALSGSAQVGIVALSLTYAEIMKSGDRWEIPAELYPPLQQAAVVVHSSTNKTAAKAFLDYVRSSEGRSILSKYGFTAPTSQDK
jgi:molybdate transport system substrate-binding protein